MYARVSVGKSFADSAFLTGAILAPLGIGLLVVVLVAGGPVELAVLFGAASGALASISLVRYFLIARNRRWLSATSKGFILTDVRGEVELVDADVSDLGTWSQIVYANGNPKSQQRKGELVLSAGESSATFPFAYKFPLSARDPLGGLFERLLARLTEQARKTLRAGGRLTGEGWSLTPDWLVYEAGGEDVELPIKAIAAAEIADSKLCVWSKGRAEAEFKVPAGSRRRIAKSWRGHKLLVWQGKRRKGRRQEPWKAAYWGR